MPFRLDRLLVWLLHKKAAHKMFVKLKQGVPAVRLPAFSYGNKNIWNDLPSFNVLRPFLFTVAATQLKKETKWQKSIWRHLIAQRTQLEKNWFWSSKNKQKLTFLSFWHLIFSSTKIKSNFFSLSLFLSNFFLALCWACNCQLDKSYHKIK